MLLCVLCFITEASLKSLCNCNFNPKHLQAKAFPVGFPFKLHLSLKRIIATSTFFQQIIGITADKARRMHSSQHKERWKPLVKLINGFSSSGVSWCAASQWIKYLFAERKNVFLSPGFNGNSWWVKVRNVNKATYLLKYSGFRSGGWIQKKTLQRSGRLQSFFARSVNKTLMYSCCHHNASIVERETLQRDSSNEATF